MRLDLGLLKGPLFVDDMGVTLSHSLCDPTFLNCEGKALGKVLTGGGIKCQAVLRVHSNPFSLPFVGEGYAYSPIL